MLKGISPLISPELLKVLAEMGHGDVIAIGDANFAAASMAKDSILVRCDGVKATDLMDAILSLMPLDTFVDDPVKIMDKEPMHADLECPVWDEFKAIVAKHDERGADCCAMISRQDYYKEAKKAYAVVATTETAFYACTLLQKGAI
ncbi:MAG: fucose isomerase [Lachnospiraceae bacterium]|nr:fucose isomerase [Candidatus Equihabitans merdae]